jgi:hypothetical protein
MTIGQAGGGIDVAFGFFVFLIHKYEEAGWTNIDKANPSLDGVRGLDYSKRKVRSGACRGGQIRPEPSHLLPLV